MKISLLKYINGIAYDVHYVEIPVSVPCIHRNLFFKGLLQLHDDSPAVPGLVYFKCIQYEASIM